MEEINNGTTVTDNNNNITEHQDNENQRYDNNNDIISISSAEYILGILLDRGYFHKNNNDNNNSNKNANDNNNDYNSSSTKNETTCSSISNSSLIQDTMKNIKVYKRNEAELIELQKQQTNNNNDDDDNNNNNKNYIMLNILKEQFWNELKKRGRWTIKDACTFFNIYDENIIHTRILIKENTNSNNSNSNNYLFIYDNITNQYIKEILTNEYIETKLINNTFNTLDKKHNGIVSIQQIATDDWNMSIENVTKILEEKLSTIANDDDDNNNVQILVRDNGSKVLVTKNFITTFQQEVIDKLKSVQVPIEIKSLIKINELWEYNWIQSIIIHKDDVLLSTTLPGIFQHGDEIYVPNCYINKQQKQIQEAFHLNGGYITLHQCITLYNISSMIQVKEYLLYNKEGKQHSIDETALIFLDHSIIQKETILVPLREAIKDTIENDTFLDLQYFIPLDIIQYEINDAKCIAEMAIEELVQQSSSLLDNSSSIVYYIDESNNNNNGGALLFSPGFINIVETNIITNLIKEYAKTRAKEIFHNNTTKHSTNTENNIIIIKHSNNDDEVVEMSAKDKRKARKAAKMNKNQQQHHDTESTHHHHISYGCVPLNDIVKAILNSYTDLSDSNVFKEICHLAFYTDEFESKCIDAVKYEIEQLEKAEKEKQQLLLLQTKPKTTNLGDFKSVDAAFEDIQCFSYACFMVQAQYKFLLYAIEHFSSNNNINNENGDNKDNDTNDVDNTTSNNNNAIIEQFKNEFLTNCCADFTKRITQYVLYKHNIEQEDLFKFEHDDSIKTTNDESSNHYYSPVDLVPIMMSTKSTTNHIYLSCKSNDNKSIKKSSDPLQVLRDVLPKSVGVALARQWILCDGTCYQGGTKQKDGNNNINDNNTYTRPGDVDGFMKHVQENCITICGIPFTKFDKKSEKKFLNQRKQILSERLATAANNELHNNTTMILDLRIIQLYQLIKNMVVITTSSNKQLLHGPILQMLIKERKISEDVAKELLNMATNNSQNSD